MTPRTTGRAEQAPPATTVHLPRGGPDASWWDRRFETDRVEYIDRPDAEARCRRVLRGLHRFQRLTGAYRVFSRLALAEVEGVPEPRVLELGAGYGSLARHLVDRHPTVRITVSDVNPAVVDAVRRGPIGHHPRVDCSVVDATAIDADDGAYDLAVLTTSLHHLAPDGVAALLREGTRAARTLLVVDGWRTPLLLGAVPLMFLTGGPAQAHDGILSVRKMYGAAALHALAERCGAPVRLRTRFALPGYLVASAARDPRPPRRAAG
ncbi:class I SAM-dependent methyltransferase [Streptomyces millisiae]|uniref:Class I SAM-dependent methyltransferase n=1 Tax=Streptomyces millisiae TaxID=3075542 RepID=A0ABU2LMI2_9ACTN|nr:class I SAM-dependent methyltransferase [Streptomyces sp. DSM 44918]MDT0318794.1 class I SAM-dependent methyltransferase [Streptomyces sp. DSM 44918]